MRRVAVRAIIMHNNKLLSCRLKDQHGNERNYWCTPGGGVDENERLIPALIREMTEETGITPSIGALLYVQQFYDMTNNEDNLEFFFHIKNAADYRHIDLEATTHGANEISQITFQDTRSILLLPHFLVSQNIADDIMHGGPTKIFFE